MLRKDFFSVSVIVVGVMFFALSFSMTSFLDEAVICPDSKVPCMVFPDHW
jgi:hypothetical protein